LKLDELIRALADARNDFIALDRAPEEVLVEREQEFEKITNATGEGTSTSSEPAAGSGGSSEPAAGSGGSSEPAASGGGSTGQPATDQATAPSRDLEGRDR
jgi:hypothetical protein